MNNNMQKMGGIAALIEAITFIIGFALLTTLLAPMATGELGATELVQFMMDNQTVIYTWNLVIYVAFGVFLIVLSLALYERLKEGSPTIMQTATALGLVWSGLVIASGMVANIGTSAVIDLYANDPTQAGTVWLSISAVQNGLGGGNEIVGGLWVVLISWAGLRSKDLPTALNTLGLIVGGAGVATLIPPLTELGAIFGLGLIAWFIWVGIILIRNRAS